MIARAKSGFSLMEILVVIGMLSVVFLLVQRPLTTLLNYPKKTVHERTDRVSGRLVYTKLKGDLRNASLSKVWRKSDVGGKTHLLVPLMERFQNAESDGRWGYALWTYEPTTKTLLRKRWSQSELSSLGVTAPRQEPTDAEWNEFLTLPLILEAEHVQKFKLDLNPDNELLQVQIEVMNPRRNGDTDAYTLKVGGIS